MFLVKAKPAEYQDPWIGSFAERKKALQHGDRRIAYYYEKPDNSTFRYRVYNMIQVISRIEGFSAAYFHHDDFQYLYEMLDIVDVLVVCRTRYTVELNQLITVAKVKGVKVLFDIDDFVFDVEHIDLILNTLDQNLNYPEVWDFWFAYIGRLGAALKLCYGCITTNHFLGEKIREFSGLNANIIPNFLNKEQLEISDHIYDDKLKNKFLRSDDINIGYFSGSPTHNKDLALVVESLAELLAVDDRVRLRIAGFIDLPDELAMFSDKIELYPFSDFVNLQRIIAYSEINIVPLQNNMFTNCKSELKFFEASAVGTLTIASPTYTYSDCIQHGENGFLARDYEWYKQLDSCIQTIGTDDYVRLAENAKKVAECKYSWEGQVALLKDVFC